MDKIYVALAETKREALATKKKLEEEIKKLKGTIHKKRRGSNDYFYFHTNDENGKTISKYLGKNQSLLQKEIEDVERKIHLSKELKEVDNNLKLIEKIENTINKNIQQRTEKKAKTSPKKKTITLDIQ